MPGQSNVFDENGNTIPASMEHAAVEEVIEQNGAESEVEEVEAEAANPAPGKYKIGDKEFATLEEAHTYATSTLATREQDQLIADAHRQGMQEALQYVQTSANVTTPAVEQAPEFDEEKLWADPKTFLAEFAEKIQNKTLNTVNQQRALHDEGTRIWNEFSSRHPALADFKSEAEYFTSQNVDAIKAIRQTKGQAAAYDFIALKLREDFQRKANALKPAKQLPNASTASPSTSASPNVTKKPASKKPLKLADQIRTLKKKR